MPYDALLRRNLLRNVELYSVSEIEYMWHGKMCTTLSLWLTSVLYELTFPKLKSILEGTLKTRQKFGEAVVTDEGVASI